ncbi:hypothetical protein LINPERPRIM_LOCUS5166 [Linum perenne]
MDSMAVISLLTSENDTSYGLEVLIFRELHRCNSRIEVKHVYSEGNHAADHLASLGYGYLLGSYTINVNCNNLVYSSNTIVWELLNLV